MIKLLDMFPVKSIIQQVLLLLSNIFTSHHQLYIIYLNITKAFDSVSHSHFHKLTFNIGGELWALFLAYVMNMLISICINQWL